MNYRVNLGNRTRLLHANLLKKYFDRNGSEQVSNDSSPSLMSLLGAAVVETE